MSSNWESAIAEEMGQLNQSGSSKDTYTTSNGATAGTLGNYTNNIFGSPFQLLDSVDRRFSSVNTQLGSEYLKNIILNSPILYIRPGVPHYTGGDDSLWDTATDIYTDVNSGNMSVLGSLGTTFMTDVIFGAGSKLQRRMFGLRETYTDYIHHVNYMLRSIAVFLGITENTAVPSYAFTAGGDSTIPFKTGDWKNYRMLVDDYPTDAWSQLKDLSDATFIGSTLGGIGEVFKQGFSGLTSGEFSIDAILGAFSSWTDSTMLDAYSARNTTVQFMVEPVALQESLGNTVEQSLVEQTIDTVGNTIGYELAFITGSNADTGMLGDLTKFMGGAVTDAFTTVSTLMSSVTGGWLNNIFNGGIRSLSGQKMIYPKIYKASNSSMSYEYSITLRSPYGDIYNYYMNILVPLCHLLALAAPRMITSNSVTSPYMVQAFIPGMSTCELGIISNMSIIKNPDANHVSVNGFPLSVKVTFTVQELYNSLAISPANDPASFLHNETLNDYLCNLGGLVPSTETSAIQSSASYENLKIFASDFFTGDYLAENVYDLIADWAGFSDG